MKHIFLTKNKGFTPAPLSKKGGGGFTLIEMLVVIAVIGMLASIVLVSLGPVRAKARDGRRIAEVRQMMTAIEAEAASGLTTAITNCAGTDVLPGDASDCTGPGGIVFANFKDPSTPGSTCRGAGDTPIVGQTTCQYSISKGSDGKAAPTIDNYQICFYLEQATVGFSAGLNKVITGGKSSAGCL